MGVLLRGLYYNSFFSLTSPVTTLNIAEAVGNIRSGDLMEIDTNLNI